MIIREPSVIRKDSRALGDLHGITRNQKPQLYYTLTINTLCTCFSKQLHPLYPSICNVIYEWPLHKKNLGLKAPRFRMWRPQDRQGIDGNFPTPFTIPPPPPTLNKYQSSFQENNLRIFVTNYFQPKGLYQRSAILLS